MLKYIIVRENLYITKGENYMNILDNYLHAAEPSMSTSGWIILLLVLVVVIVILAVCLTVIILNAFVHKDTNYKTFYTKFSAIYDNADAQSDDFDGPIIIALLGNASPEVQASLQNAKIGDEVNFDCENPSVMNISIKRTGQNIGYIFVGRSGFIKKVSDNPENYSGRITNYYFIEKKKEVEIQIQRRK